MQGSTWKLISEFKLRYETNKQKPKTDRRNHHQNTFKGTVIYSPSCGAKPVMGHNMDYIYGNLTLFFLLCSGGERKSYEVWNDMRVNKFSFLE